MCNRFGALLLYAINDVTSIPTFNPGLRDGGGREQYSGAPNVL